MPTSQIKKRLLRGLAISALLLVLFEIGLRVAGYSFPPVDAPMLMWTPEEDKKLDKADNLHQRDVHQEWALRPGVAVPYGADERINDEGYRGPLLAHEKAADVLRIATLGDSSTFGLGVSYGETFSAQLAELCTARGLAAEVLDAGVIGFTVRQGIERYKELVRPLRPDVVVAAFGSVNEHYSAPGARTDAQKITDNHERDGVFHQLERYVRVHLRIAHLIDAWAFESRGGREAMLQAWAERQVMQSDDRAHCGEIEFAGLRRVSLDEFRTALRELAREVASDGARLVLVAMPRAKIAEDKAPILPFYSQAILDVAREDSIAVADARTLFRERQAHGAEPALFLKDDYWHPSPAGHRAIAEALVPMVLSARRD